ncbi:ribosome biogenesis GTPase YlqF [Evansella cellulosilytica]|uniref:Ribosome biogenesis GTPase A n=1 Tax=Evansella cellulosilytica (strain ATCC 21833 / DSM 2522 / FERM P-1141 / JCM 9156 / N-4) TaxID=649639 RepID=E6TSY5_EVAC2|nr:ribosome biogenesis GTPase YlqF [Evansella cellulosilytica]ADU30777.1 ribosome biogenesis GTP-binding protein YlqF [Evansella cellulosilytica DSM 2522]
MSIQWFPGHMAKAKRQVQEKLKVIDVVIELVDARVPLSSRNPMIDELVKSKPRLILLNKSDLADQKVTDLWVKYFETKGFAVQQINAQKGTGVKKIPAIVEKLAKPITDKMRAKGMNPRAVRALILGIPNVGKSTIINRLANKRIATVGDKPGVTKAQQWIKVGKEMELLDTPGILWPKFEDESVGFRLALTGAIKEELFDFNETTLFLLRYLAEKYPERLKDRYKLENIPENIVEIYDHIGKLRGTLMSGGLIDYDRVSEILFREFRSGMLGNITLEYPPN